MSDSGIVQTRRVYYIPGFDPFPARRYRELYRKQSAEQAAISDYYLDVFVPPDAPANTWQIKAAMGGNTCTTTFEVLEWADIVASYMRTSIWICYLNLMRTILVYVWSGALFRMIKMRKGPIIAAFYPVFFMFTQLGVALGFSIVVFRFVGAIHPFIGMVSGLFAFISLMQVFRQLDRHLYAQYLMQDYAFSAQCWGAYPAPLQERLARFRDQVFDGLRSNVDEVLIIGHSSGVHLGVSLLADILRTPQPIQGPHLGFLSLGQAVPMVSFLPGATELRRDLHDLSQNAGITWVDVSAPGDGCCFALCDPVAVSGVAPEDKRWPLVLSAAFSQTLSAERRRVLRWRFFRLHFQYLCSFDQPDWYDYFAITAGPRTLADRFAGRSPSKSRIERPLSSFTDMAQ